MPELPIGYSGGSRVTGYGFNTGSTKGTTVTASASGDTKGSWTQLTASTDFDANWIIVQFPYNEWGGDPFLVDIGIGGSGSEQVIIPDLQVYAATPSPYVNDRYMFPVFIPRGSRLSARCQENFASSAYLDVAVQLIAGNATAAGVASLVSAYGSTTNSQGTTVDPGGSANTKGSWVQITAATTRSHNWLTFAAMNYDGFFSASLRWLVDIGIGGSGSEQVLIPNLALCGTALNDMPERQVQGFPVSVPAGERLAVRAQCSATTAGDRVLQVKLYGAG